MWSQDIEANKNKIGLGGLTKGKGTLLQANVSTDVFINRPKSRQGKVRWPNDGGYGDMEKTKQETKQTTGTNKNGIVKHVTCSPESQTQSAVTT